jgi:hypothetical protein
MNVLNRKWTRINANNVERASRSYSACGGSAGGKKPAFRRLCVAGLLCCSSVSAQTARELFDPPAKEYILGNTAAARNLVHQALEKYPEDERLQKLKELIEQQQEQQNQNQNQNQNQEQQKNQDNPQNQQQDHQQNQEQSDSQDQEQEEQKRDQPPDPSQEPRQPREQPQAQPRQAGQMTPEEAQQLLDAMRQDEQDRRTDLRPYLGAPVRVEKDW